MSDYTPTTEDIRNAYMSGDWNDNPTDDDAMKRHFAAKFDRWLTAHDAEVEARGYQQGREDAAKAVETALNDYMYGEECGPPEFRLIAAARGEGEPTVIRSPAVEKLENFKPLFADTQYGRIYFKGSCTHSRTQYTREVCWCGDAVDACDDCGIDVHECGLDGEK